jgi:hypothetical protein
MHKPLDTCAGSSTSATPKQLGVIKMRLEILKPQVNIAQSRLSHDPQNLFCVIIAGLLTPKIS